MLHEKSWIWLKQKIDFIMIIHEVFWIKEKINVVELKSGDGRPAIEENEVYPLKLGIKSLIYFVEYDLTWLILISFVTLYSGLVSKSLTMQRR